LEPEDDMSLLHTPLILRGATFRNRAWVAPMCQYSSVDGMPADWHLVHLGSFARGGAGLVVAEASAVLPEGRITPHDAGMWSDAQTAPWARIVRFLHGQGAAAGIQLAHAGRKASMHRPWEGGRPLAAGEGAWRAVAPSPLPFGDWPVPEELSVECIAGIVDAFAAAAVRADAAGFDVVEVHAAHGYLIHQFLSPLTNHRRDAFGGDLDGRSRLLRDVVAAVRDAWPEEKPVFVRLSATDWAAGGWDLPETVEVARRLRDLGVDLIDVSSGGAVPHQQVMAGPGYQVPFARKIRREAGVPVAAVGLITEPVQAEQILLEGSADAVFLARELLRDPHWPLRAGHELGTHVADQWPAQYLRALPR
jgi:2,4-dienoyl-CoA reductase-like NADH-dependent reductase (Old Yellow Enzyme family)